jgi:hypothetical protein
MKRRPSENLNAAIKLLDTISPKHLRGSDPVSLSKFMQLCHHWQLHTLAEVNRRTAEALSEQRK